MKTTLAPAASASAETPQPSDDGLRRMLGRAYPALEQVTAWLCSNQPTVTIEERFPAQTGWHRIYLLKKRRLFYLTPMPGDFRFAVVLGDKAIALLRQGAFADQLAPLLDRARRYGEGTAFIFDRKSFDPPLAIALLQAKIAH